MNRVFVRQELSRFLAEDLGAVEVDDRDGRSQSAFIESQEAGVMCGGRFLSELFGLLITTPGHPLQQVSSITAEGVRFGPRVALAGLTLHPDVLKNGIRTALNLLGHLCGVANRTYELQLRIAGTGCQLMDTRKTTPGLREFEKYAVRIGGGRNHRHGRFDGVMLKKEDLAIDGGVKASIDKALETAAHLTAIEVEVESLGQLDEVLEDGRVRHVLLDNIHPQLVERAVRLAGERVVLEASGVLVEDLEVYAATGVPFISTSALILGAKPTKMHLVMHPA